MKAQDVALRALDAVVAGFLVLFIFSPLGILVLLSITEEWGRAFGSGFTVKWLLEIPRVFGPAIVRSVIVASGTMLATLVLSALLAYVVVTRKFRATVLVDALVMAPLTVSYIVLGLAMILAFNRAPLRLHGTVALLIIGHVMISLPLAYRTVHAMMEAADLSLVEAARSLGASEWLALRRVVLPMVAPGLVASSLLAFVTSLQNYSMTFMVAPDRYKTVPIELFEYIFAETGNYTNYNLAAAVSLALMAMIVGVLWAVRLVTRQSWYENLNV